MLSIRLDKETEKQLDYTAKMLGKSKSEVVRESIVAYISKVDKPSAWDVGADLFGQERSGDGSLSKASRSQIAEKIRAKKS